MPGTTWTFDGQTQPSLQPPSQPANRENHLDLPWATSRWLSLCGRAVDAAASLAEHHGVQAPSATSKPTAGSFTSG